MLIAALVIVLLAGAAVGAVYSPIFDLDEVRSTSSAHVQGAVVVEAAALRSGAPLLFVDTAAAKRRIEEIPWVHRATVTKSFPGSIHISFTERVPVGSIEREVGRYAVLDATGRVLVDESSPVHPVLDGVAEIPSPGGVIATPELAKVAHDLGHTGLAQGTLSLSQDSRGNRTYSVAMPGAIEIRLGNAKEIARKARLAAKILFTMPEGSTYIDISTPEHPVSGGGATQTGESANPAPDEE